nr:hypothetical protein [Tanacetum cinerariifolium]
MSNANSISASISNAPVKDSMNDVKSGCLCAICGKCMIAKTHHACVHLVVTEMNESQKSKSVKKHKNQSVWKPTGNRSQLMNFVCKFLGPIRFRNNQIARIIGFFRTKDEAPAAIIKCIKNIQLALLSRTVLPKVKPDTRRGCAYDADISRAPSFLWAEAINTACYTQNCSLIRHRYNKMPYELMQDKKPDLSFLHVFRALYYPTNDNEDLVQEAAAPRAEVLADSPVSTSIYQEAPSISISSSQEQEHSLIFYQGFKESPKTPTFHDDPLNESPHEDTTSKGSSLNVRQIHTPFKHIGRRTKDHLIANVIGDPSRSVSIGKQLETVAMWCYFDAFLTCVEPKNFKQAMTEPSWIDAMQEENHEFERLEV